MRHTIVTMGMADLGRVFRNYGEAGERRLRRKRSTRCRTPIRTLPDLSWTRAPGAGHEPLILTNDFVKFRGGGTRNSGAFQLAYRCSSSVRIIGTFKGISWARCTEISLIFHCRYSNLPIDFVKIGG
jgi:hypothetical protein